MTHDIFAELAFCSLLTHRQREKEDRKFTKKNAALPCVHFLKTGVFVFVSTHARLLLSHLRGEIRQENRKFRTSL
jgi:hypothetical protein